MNDLMTKSFLSYVELQRQAQKDLEGEQEFQTVQLHDVNDQNLGQFFREVNSIKVVLEEISNLLLDLEILSQEVKTAHSKKLLRGLRDRMESDVISVLKRAKVIKASIEALEKENVANRKVCDLYQEGSLVDRTRVSATNGLRIKLKEMMNQFHSLRENFISDYKKDLKRRYYTVTGEEPSEEYLDNMISKGAEVEVLHGTTKVGWGSKETHDAVMDLKKSLTRLQQVFLDMAILVETQGEQFNDIEENMVNARNYIAGGTNSLQYANQMKKKNFPIWWLWSAILFILFICVVKMLAS